MEIQADIRLLEEDKSAMRTIVIGSDGKGRAEVVATADIKGTILDGEFAGRVINTFVWLDTNPDGDVWNVTEFDTGFRLARMPIGVIHDGSNGVDHSPPDEVYNAMMPAMMNACAKAAFDRFMRASEEQLRAMMEVLDSKPRIHPTVVLH